MPAPKEDYFGTPASTSSGSTGTDTPELASDDLVKKLLGHWVAEISIPQGGGAALANLLATQEQLAQKYGKIQLDLKDDDTFVFTVFGIKLEGGYRVVAGFVELRSEKIMGLTFDEAKKTPPKGPDGVAITDFSQWEEALNLEVIENGKHLRFDQGSNSTVFTFTKPDAAAAAPGSAVPNVEKPAAPSELQQKAPEPMKAPGEEVDPNKPVIGRGT